MEDLSRVSALAAAGAVRLAWSPDGQRIALGSADRLRVVDPADGAEAWQVAARAGACVAFSPDGKRIAASAASGSDEASVRLAVFDATSGASLWSRSEDPIDPTGGATIDPDNPVGSAIGIALAGGLAWMILTQLLYRRAQVRFSLDGRLLAHAGVVLDAATGAMGPSLPAEPDVGAQGMTVHMTPAFAPDSQRLLARTEVGVALVDARTGQQIWAASCPERPVWAGFLGDEVVIVCDPAFEVVHLDPSTGGQIARHALDPESGIRLPFFRSIPAIYGASPDGRSLVAVGGSIVGAGEVVVHDLADGTARFPLMEVERNPGALILQEIRVACSPVGDRLALNRPGLTLLRTRSGGVAGREPDGAVPDLTFSPNGSRLAALVDDELRLYDTGLMAPPANAGGPVRAVSVTGGETPLLAVGSQGADGHGVATVFDVADGAALVEKRDQGLVTAALLSSDGHGLATGRTTGAVAVYDTTTGTRLFELRHADAVNDLALDPAGTLLATASNDKSARLIETASGTERWRATHPRAVRLVLIDPGRAWVATACADQTTRVLDAATGDVAASFSHEGQIRALTAARTRSLLAVAHEGGAVLVIDPSTGLLIGQVDHPRPVSAAALDGPGDLLASGGRDNAVRISVVSVSSVAPKLSVRTAAEVIALVFSPVRSLLAVATGDGVVSVLDAGSGDLLARLTHPGDVSAMAFGADGSLLAVGCADGFGYTYRADWS